MQIFRNMFTFLIRLYQCIYHRVCVSVCVWVFFVFVCLSVCVRGMTISCFIIYKYTVFILVIVYFYFMLFPGNVVSPANRHLSCELMHVFLSHGYPGTKNCCCVPHLVQSRPLLRAAGSSRRSTESKSRRCDDLLYLCDQAVSPGVRGSGGWSCRAGTPSRVLCVLPRPRVSESVSSVALLLEFVLGAGKEKEREEMRTYTGDALDTFIRACTAAHSSGHRKPQRLIFLQNIHNLLHQKRRKLMY